MIKQIFVQLYLHFPEVDLSHYKNLPVIGQSPIFGDDNNGVDNGADDATDYVTITPDWAVISYGDVDAKTGNPTPAITTLENDDRVSLFNRIAKGDVLWDGVVDMQPSQVCTGAQRGLDQYAWLSMFMRKMPAILKRDGDEYHGVLEPFREQGFEGHTALEFMEFGYSGYGSLRGVRSGDHLTVYKTVTDGGVDWCGTLSFETGDKPVTHDRQTFLRDVKHMPIQNWAQATMERRPAILTRNLG